MVHRRTHATLLAGLVLVGATCSSDDDPAASAPTEAPVTVAPVDPTGSTDAAAIDDERCQVNRDAGTITYLSGFDFAASASIVDIIVADAKGYYDDLCLDVELRSSFSTSNYPLVAADEAQFASGGSFTELLDFSVKNTAELVAVAVEGKTGIDALIVKDGEATTLEDLRGSTIGVKGALTSSVKAMLAQAGLTEHTDYETVLIDGFDPLAHIAIDSIVGFPGYKSNEPGQLERAGVPFTLFNPADDGIPGSFGVIFSNRRFLTQHPQAATDFLRATMKGLAEAIADPEAAATTAIEYINGAGNPNFLSPEGEMFRWATESQIVVGTTPDDEPIGRPDAALLQAEVDAYARAGIFFDAIPVIDGYFDPSFLDAIYASDLTVRWPG